MTRRGMTLVEMLVAMTVFLVVLGASLRGISVQSRGFTRGADETGILQNLRYGVDQVDQELQNAGANVPERQPPVVFASGTAIAFNADLVSNLAGDISAVYVDPAAPAGQVSALTTAATIGIPGSTPVFTYPSANYTGLGGGNSPAELITFWFMPDPETTRTDDFVLMRQVNNQPAEPLVRNALAPAAGQPFFRYRYLNTPATGAPTVDTVPTAWLPLRHTAAQHGQVPDTGAVARIDQLRAVELRYRVTNQRPGAQERIRDIATVIPLPNMGLKKLQTCGDEPLFTQPVSAVPVGGYGDSRVDVSFGASVDEASGERDVIRYVVWRRVAGNPDWGDPFTSLPSGTAPYLYSDLDVVPGTQYQYQVAAQDCTPALSPRSTSATVTAALP
jgi:prepilin-type N-terminal cleavage/methylation domain-containing protein